MPYDMKTTSIFFKFYLINIHVLFVFSLNLFKIRKKKMRKKCENRKKFTIRKSNKDVLLEEQWRFLVGGENVEVLKAKLATDQRGESE